MEKALAEANLKTVKVDIDFKATLEKHLHQNEELCTTCDGAGMVVGDNKFGIGGVKTNEMFPFNNKALSFCPDCYNGVRKRCEHCSNLIKKGWLVCDCETIQQQKHEQDKIKEQERWDKTPKITLEQALKEYEMLYVSDFDEFVNTDNFKERVLEKQEEETFSPKELKIYTTRQDSIALSAEDIVENALEDLHENAEVGKDAVLKLQEYLDTWCKENGKGTVTYTLNENLGVVYNS